MQSIENLLLFVFTDVEKRHSDAEIAHLQRHLLQSNGAVPKCEIDLSYDVTSITASQVTADFTIFNHRELDSHWQLVYKYKSSSIIHLSSASGATVLSNGSVNQDMVRLVDQFSFNSTGIAAGGSYTFSVDSNVGNSGGTGTSLLIQSVNVNGLKCSQVTPTAGALMGYQDCASALSFFSAFSGGSQASVSAANACRATFCCGFILSSISPSPNNSPVPSPQPEPAAILLPAHNATTPPSTEAAAQQSKDSPGPESSPAPYPLPTSPSSPPPAPELSPLLPIVAGSGNGFNISATGSGTLVNSTNSTTTAPQSGGHSSDTALLAGISVAAVFLIGGLAAAVIILRRRRQAAQRVRDGDKADYPSNLGGGGSPSGHTTRQSVHSDWRSWNRRGTLTGSFLGGAMWPGRNAKSPTSGTPSREPSGSHGSPHEEQQDTSDFSSCSLPALPPSDDTHQDVTIYEQLGSGAFGTVYKGDWGGQRVAVKVLQTACASSSKELDSFRQEVAVLSRLRHPNIIAFLAACTVPPDICIIEELAEGGSLHAAIHGTRHARKSQPFCISRLVSVAIDISEAMVYLHPRIVHRDLKSQNVLLDGEGRAKVCDFGIAKFKDRTFVSTINGQAGTPAYMAPELFDGGQVTEKVDVYSFAILMWEMLTGNVPWGNVPSPMQIIYYVGVLQQRPPVPEGCPEALKILIEKCWAELPSERPEFREILDTLKKIRADSERDGTASWAYVAESSVEGSDGESGQPRLLTDAYIDRSNRIAGVTGVSTNSSFNTQALHSYASEASARTTEGERTAVSAR